MALLDKFFGLAVGGWDGDWVVISSKIMPLRGPTCKISSRVEIPKLDQFFDLAVVVGGWLVGWVVIWSKIMPLRGPTCKIARFRAGLKFPIWTKCGKAPLEKFFDLAVVGG